MKDISNTTVGMLVIVAIIVSVFGTLFSISKLADVSDAPGITGYASSLIVTANLTVPGTASITITSANNDPNSNGSVIELGSLEPGESNYSDHSAVNDWWIINNDGSVNVSIDLYATTQGSGRHANNIGFGPFSSDDSTDGSCLNSTTHWATGFSNYTCFKVKCANSTSGYSCNNTYYPLPNAAGMIDFVIDLAPQGDLDNATFGVNVTVPDSELSGNKEQDISVVATVSE